MDENGFVRRLVNGVPIYSCRRLEHFSDLRHGFSTRHGGVSPLPDRALNLSHISWDSPDCVEENRRRFLDALQLHTGQLCTVRQAHTSQIHIIGEVPVHWNPPEGDALVTGRPGVALAVKTADCFPILIVDPTTRVIASVHSGWKGTLARILFKTMEAMRGAFACDPSRLLVAIGPAIRPCCFEVGSEVADLFGEQYPGIPLASRHAHQPGKYFLDLGAALRVQLKEAGIPEDNVHDLGLCTKCRNDEFFSYRAEGPRSGRMMAVIARVAPAKRRTP